MLDSPQVETTGELYGFSISQKLAYDSRDLLKAGISLAIENGAFRATGMIDGVVGDDANSSGIGGQLSIVYNF